MWEKAQLILILILYLRESHQGFVFFLHFIHIFLLIELSWSRT